MDGAVGGRCLGGLRLVWAMALLCWPERVIAALGGEVTSQSRRIGRVLGVRHFLQGVAEVSVWPRGRRFGSIVDAVHASSVAVSSLITPRWRRPLERDAAVAASFAIAGASRAPRPR
jgi:hypothetical protein